MLLTGYLYNGGEHGLLLLLGVKVTPLVNGEQVQEPVPQPEVKG